MGTGPTALRAGMLFERSHCTRLALTLFIHPSSAVSPLTCLVQEQVAEAGELSWPPLLGRGVALLELAGQGSRSAETGPAGRLRGQQVGCWPEHFWAGGNGQKCDPNQAHQLCKGNS